jgi:hypothetical protein
VYVNGACKRLYLQPSPYRVDFRRHVLVNVGKLPRAADQPGAKAAQIRGKPREIADMKFTPLSIGENATLPCLCWAEDGKAFFHVDQKTGTVRRIGWGDLEEQAALETDRKCTWCSLSSEGLVVALGSPYEIWVLDSTTLQVLRKIPSDYCLRLLTLLDSSLAYCISRNAVTVVNLTNGRRLKEYVAKDLAEGANPYFATLTPDGAKMFLMSDRGQLLRFKVSGAEVEFEEASPRISDQYGTGGVYLSPDGKQVCAPCGGGNHFIAGTDAVPRGAYVFSTNDLNRPVLAVPEAYPIVGFHAASGLLFTKGRDAPLVTFNKHGLQLQQYRFDPGYGRQILGHPRERKVLVLCANHSQEEKSQLWLVELPAEKP